MAHVALAWLLSKETINSPIIGARTVNQLQEIIGATELTLSSDEIATLDKVTDE
jgi:aryl-alcohol dehydrogenase-like predicted oxidoreductase